MKRNGFTLVEMLAVIALVGLLAVIGVATYTNVNESAKRKALEAKLEEIRSSAMKWARENNINSRTIISVNALVVEGYLTADKNEMDKIGYIENPVTGENMICNTVDITFKNSEMVAEVDDKVQNCDLATQSLIDDKIDIKVIDENNVNKTGSKSMSSWTNKNVILVVSSAEYEPNAVSISFDFEGNTKTKMISGSTPYTGSNYLPNATANTYYNVFNVDGNLLLNSKVVVTYALNDGTIKSRSYTVRIDKEEATASIKSNNEWLTVDKDIYVQLDDGNGSGAKGFIISTDDSCNNIVINQEQKSYDGTAVHLDIGKYYVWTEDIAGNRSAKPKVIFEVNNVDRTIPWCDVEFVGTVGDHGWFKEDPVQPYGINDADHLAGLSGFNLGVNLFEDSPEYSAYAEYDTYNRGAGALREDNTPKSGTPYYCHVKTLAGNYANNSKLLFLDRTPPTISVSVTDSNVHTKTKQATFYIQDALSGLNASTTIRIGFSQSSSGGPTTWENVVITAPEQSNAVASTTTEVGSTLTGTWYMWVDTSSFTDYAGNHADPPSGSSGTNFVYGPYKFDNTPPVCFSNNGKKTWTDGTFYFNQVCTDDAGTTDQSGCMQTDWPRFYDAFTSIWSDTIVIEDNAHNTTTCSYDVYLDNDDPTCNGNDGKANWTRGSWSGNQYCKDDYSDCSRNPFPGYWNTSTDQSSITISDNLGHTTTCGYSVRLDTEAPTCRSESSADGWTNQQVTIKGICSDTGGSECMNREHFYGGVTYSGTYAMNQFADEQDAWHNPGYVYDNAGNRGECQDVHVQIDRTKPTCSTVTYGSDSESGVTVSVACSDPTGYGGIRSGCSSGSFSGGTCTGPGSVTISDNAGNTESCDYTVSSYKQHSTRDWNTCKSGNECVSGTKYTYKCAITAPGCTWVSSNTSTCNSMYGEDYWKCPYTDPCASRTPCEGGWNDWGGWSNGVCPRANTSTWECKERTMYHGG